MIQVQSKDTTKKLVEQQKSVLAEAKKLIKKGFWIVPTRDKISLSSNDKNSRLSYSEFEKILKQKNGNGLGILTNTLTNYVSFDLDTKDATNSKLFERRLLFELDNFPDLKAKIKISQTPSGGFHLYLLTEKQEQKKQFFGAFAWSEYSKGEKQKQTVTGRSDGQYCCEFPTKNYNWILDNDLQVLNEKDINNLFNIFSVLNEDKNRNERKANNLLRIKQKQLEKAKLQANWTNFETEITVWDDFNARNNIETILLKHNFSIVFCKYDKTYFLRDGSKNKTSGFVQNDLYLNFSDNAGLPNSESGNGRKFTAFDLVVHLEYNSDYSEATKALSKQGYGRSKVIESERITAKKIEKNTFLGYEVERFELSKSQYISDVYNDNLKEQTLMFLGKTGLGKSTLIKSYNHSIVASFLSTTVQNYENEGFNVFNGTDLNYDITDVLSNEKNATTFKSLETVYNAKMMQYDNIENFYKEVVLVIDEFQQTLTDFFAQKTMQKTIEIIKNHIKNGGKVRLLTANELIFNFDFFDDLKIKHFIKDEILKPLYSFSFDSSKKIETFANFVNVSHERERKILALTNRTELHNDNVELQKLTSNKALNLDSKSKNNFNFSKGLDTSIFATTALNTGVNIYEKKTDSVIFEYNDFTQLSQFWGRLRYKQKENFYTKSNSYTLFNNFDFNEKSLNYTECLEQSLKHLKNLIKNAKSEIEYCINSEITKNKASHGSNVIWNNDLNISEVDYLKINQINHSYLNTLLHSNRTAFVEMIKRQGYEIEFKEYEYEIKSEVFTDDNINFKQFFTALKFAALCNIQKQCFVTVNSLNYAKEYKNKSFDFWFKKASFKDATIQKLYSSYKELTNILVSDKLSFEVLTDIENNSDVIFDNFIKKSSRSTTENLKLVDSRRIIKRFAFAAAYYKIDSVKFHNFVNNLTGSEMTMNEILNVLTTANNKYEIKFFDNTSESEKASLKASLGIVSELKKWFGNDFTSIVRKTLLSIDKDDNSINKTLIRVLSNHFDTDVITWGSGSERSKSYQFRVIGKKSDFK